MKTFTKILSSIALLLILSIGVMAQVPQGFNFQAVATAPDGTPIASVEIGVQIEVVKGSEDGSVLYTETHTVTTNPLGLFQIVIGEGTPAEGNDFSAIDWGNDNYYVGFGVDLTGAGAFESLGKTRLLSVPYALLAQDVVNGSGIGDEITDYELDVSAGDTAFTVFMTGDEGDAINPALRGYANTVGFNIGVDGIGESVAGNTTFQYGVRGIAFGEGTGLHYGLRGEARAANAWNVAVRGQSIWESTQANYGGWFSGRNSGAVNIGLVADARDLREAGVQYNTAVLAQSSGPGNGNPDELGSYNTGVRTEVFGNTWGNQGISASTFGEVGVDNAGVYAESLVNDGSTTIENRGVVANAYGPGVNYGIVAAAWDGAENYAGWFDGEVVINGDLTVNGNINGEGSGGGVVTDINLDATVDTAFTVTISGDEGPVNNSAIIGLANTGGTNVGVEGKAHSNTGNERFQIGSYGEALGDGTGSHYAFYGYATGNGKFTQGTRNFVSGPGNGEIVPIGDPEEQNGNFGSFNIGYSTYVQGNANGNTGLDIEIGGDQGSRINIGAEARVFTTSAAQNSGFQAIINGSSTLNRGYWGYINGDNNNVGMDLTVEGGTSNTGLIVNADVAADFNGTVEIDGNTTSTGSIRSVGTNDATFTSASDFNSLPEVSMNSQNDANAEFIARVENNGSVDFATLSIADENLSNQVFISGENGSVTATTLNQTSDSRLKTNVTTLSNALVNTLEMRGVSYNWIDENKSQNTQIGVIAQEVEEIYPEFVHTNDEGMKSVNYSQMVAVLIEAVKELNNKIEVLEEENTELQAQVNDIETMRAQLNQLMTLINVESNVESFSADK